MFIKINSYDIARGKKMGVAGRYTIYPHVIDAAIINTDNIKYISKMHTNTMYDYEWLDVKGEELYIVYLGGANEGLGLRRCK